MSERQYVKIFTRFERFWHWMQALLVLALLFSGARLHGLIGGLDWSVAFMLHLVAAGLIILLWIFAIFWHFTTGAWQHYIPTLRNLVPVIRYYGYGIFRGEAHPAKPTIHRKHNPLQRLSYLFLKLVINPAIWATGILYLTINLTGFGLETVAWLHVVAAYAMAIFVIVHVYMATTGDTPAAYVKAMIIGYEWVVVDDEEAEKRAEPCEPAVNAEPYARRAVMPGVLMQVNAPLDDTGQYRVGPQTEMERTAKWQTAKKPPPQSRTP